MKTVSILLKLPKELNEFLLDEVARIRTEKSIRTSKEAIIISLINKYKNNGN